MDKSEMPPYLNILVTSNAITVPNFLQRWENLFYRYTAKGVMTCNTIHG